MKSKEIETEKCECCEKEINVRHLKMTDDGVWFCKNCIDLKNTYSCPNCKKDNIFSRPLRRQIVTIVGFCKHCNHPVWK